jgi:dienelactone hydrolase
MEQVQDTQAAIDFLQTRVEVDASRIGVMGHSFGAAVAIYTAGIDQRVAACVSTGGWGDGEKKFRKQHPALLLKLMVSEFSFVVISTPLLSLNKSDVRFNDSIKFARFTMMSVSFFLHITLL